MGRKSQGRASGGFVSILADCTSKMINVNKQSELRGFYHSTAVWCSASWLRSWSLRESSFVAVSVPAWLQPRAWEKNRTAARYHRPVQDCRSPQWSWAKIAAKLGVGEGTVFRAGQTPSKTLSGNESVTVFESGRFHPPKGNDCGEQVLLRESGCCRLAVEFLRSRQYRRSILLSEQAVDEMED